MQKIHTTYEEFMSYLKIKPGIVHLNDGIVYKHSPNSEEIIQAIEESKTHPVFKHISIPLSYLKIKDLYFGYTYEFKNDIHLVEDAIYLGIINNINEFISELLKIVEELNKLNMCYWDFHRNNIYSDKNGVPFIIDIDDMVYNPTRVNQYHQVKYLTEYILNLLLDQEKTLSQFLRDPAMQKHMSIESMDYIESLIRRTGTVTTLPYKLIEELSNPYKRELIKSKIK